MLWAYTTNYMLAQAYILYLASFCVCLSIVRSLIVSARHMLVFNTLFFPIDIGRCGVRANETTFQPNNNL